jgi:hypothetical protein
VARLSSLRLDRAAHDPARYRIADCFKVRHRSPVVWLHIMRLGGAVLATAE